ncbi:diguanylate cyclase domain-containing protein [Isoptericola dokdonensis]|uniref:Putative diguanylate cyclase YeaP n=1 Tax=Isoptericola dokdonensis DS-3 TaxID=1300344 RepID=A0A168FXF1_9MICO|nr:diguanylate cyclase [Isoptericola dokdonensis]ANC32676.1 putative diguanylate cyclase YeaP [Isoptericola dokdonensis DS-3]
MHDEISQVARHRQLRGGVRLAGVVSDLAQPLTVVGSSMPVGQLEVMFRNPEVTCVVVEDEESDRVGMVMRAGLAAALTGRLGYGRAVLERRPVATVTHWEPMVVRPDEAVSAVATRAMERTEEHRYDDVLVAGPTWAGAGTADLMRSLVAALAERSSVDPQTRLPARAATWHSLGRRCELVRGGGTRVVVVLLDVAGMSRLNARHGLATGDAVLTELGARLRDDLPRGCEAGRVDGDRFAVLAILPPMDDVHAAASADQLRRYVLARVMEPPAHLDALVWPDLRSSVVWSAEGSGDPERLVREAEARLATGDDLTVRAGAGEVAKRSPAGTPPPPPPPPAPPTREADRSFSDSVRVEGPPAGAPSLPSRRAR